MRILNQYDMVANGSVLVVSYQQCNTIRWYNPTTGALLDSATVPVTQSLSVASNSYITR